MVPALGVIRNMVESCSTKIIITIGIAISPAIVPEKSGNQDVVITSGAFTLTSVIQLLNHEKRYIKSEVEEIHFKLATNDHSDEAFLLTSKFWP